MLTHQGFSVSEIARVTRMSYAAVVKLAQGKIMHDIDVHMHYALDDGE